MYRGRAVGMGGAMKDGPAVECDEEQTAHEKGEQTKTPRPSDRAAEGMGTERHGSSAERLFQPEEGQRDMGETTGELRADTCDAPRCEATGNNVANPSVALNGRRPLARRIR
jgi:hypothetical protein